jgi:hypothetical protein
MAVLRDDDRRVDAGAEVGEQTADGVEPTPGSTDADQRVHLVLLPVMLPRLSVASTKPEATLDRSKAGLPC